MRPALECQIQESVTEEEPVELGLIIAELALTSSFESTRSVFNVSSSAPSRTSADRARPYTRQRRAIRSFNLAITVRDRVRTPFDGDFRIT
jgi:hypothetical protein